jgi:hypothetical protein
MLKYLTVLILLLTVVVVMRLDEFSVSNIGQQQTLIFNIEKIVWQAR